MDDIGTRTFLSTTEQPLAKDFVPEVQAFGETIRLKALIDRLFQRVAG